MVLRASALVLLLAAAVPTHAASRYFKFNHATPPLYQRSYGTASDPLPTTPRGRTKCPRSIVSAAFSRIGLDCGNDGFTTPGLIKGDCPMVACMLRPRETGAGPFGSMRF